MANVVRYMTGFEGWPVGTPVVTGGGLGSAVAGTPTVGAAYTRIATRRGMQINPVASADESVDLPTFTGQAVAAYSFYVKPVTLDTSAGAYGVAALFTQISPGEYLRFGVTSANLWEVCWVNAVGTLLSNVSGPAVVTGAWTLVELLLDASANPWTARWRVGGVDQTAPATYAHTASTFRKCAVGAFGTGNRTVEFHFDDAVVIDGTDQSMWPPGGFDIEGVTADQTAAAQHVTALTGWAYTDNNFTASTGITTSSETASRSRVNVLGDATHGVQNSSNSPAGNLRYPIADPVNTGVPRAVSLICAGKEASSGTNNATFRTRLSTSTTNLFTGNPGWVTTLNYLGITMDAKPGGGTWTLQNVKDMLFEFASSDGNPAVRLMGFQYEVAFPSASSYTYSKAGFAKENA